MRCNKLTVTRNISLNGAAGYTLNGGYSLPAGSFMNCLFTDNQSYNQGTVYFDDGNGAGPIYTNCTFSGNRAAAGNLIYYLKDANGAAPSFRNCIIDNSSSGPLTFGTGTVTFEYSLTNFFSLGSNPTNIVNTNPQFTNAATGNYSLKITSPAINAGNNAYFTDAATATDFAGNPRLNGTIDIGAYEYQGSTDCGLNTTWNGTAWDNGTPTSNRYAAVIAGAYTSTGNLTACSLTVNSGAVVVNPTHNFIIKGVVDVAGGSLTFEDNANLVQADDVDNSGSITYKKDSNPLRYLDYTLWSSPTIGTQKLKDFSTETLDTRFYVYNTALSAYSNYTSASGIFGSNPNAVGFTPAKGYLIRMPDGLPATGTTVFTGVFTGVPNNGNTSIAAPAGYNAVGNPYPSPINVHNFIDANNTILDNDGTLYFWRKTNDTAEPTYATINKLAYVKNTAPGGDTGTGYFAVGNEANWVINPGQGFLVKSLGGSLNFTNSMRRALNTGQFFRMDNQVDSDSSNPGYTDVSRYYLNITNAAGRYGETAIAYTTMATTGLDYGFDGRLVNDGAISIYSLSGSTKLAIQARPQFNDTDVVTLGYKVTTAGTYTITIAQQDNLFANGQEVYLKDKLTGTTHQLNQGSYIFTTEAGTFTDRFEAVYTNGTLGVTNPVAALNNLIVYSKNGDIHITNGTIAIEDVKVFDTRGRLVAHKNGVNKVQAIVSGLNVQQQVLLVQVTTIDNATTTKKIIL